MPDGYVPEIGQALFGCPFYGHPCPEFLKALVLSLASDVCRIENNRDDRTEEFNDPTQNTGERWSNDTFSFRAYYWGDDEAEARMPNFKCGDIEVRWYKHLRRGTTINRVVSPQEAVEMFDACLASLERYDGQVNPGVADGH